MIVLLAIAGLVPSLAAAFAVNSSLIALLSAAPSFGDLRNHWYGAGLVSVSNEQAQRLFHTNAVLSGQAYCAAWEQKTLQNNLVSFRGRAGDGRPIELLLRARQRECAGRFAEALEILDREAEAGRVDAQKVELLLRLGREDEAYSIAQRNICPTPAKWCAGYLGYLMSVWDQDGQGEIGSATPGDLHYWSNGNEQDLASLMKAVGSLTLTGNPNVIVERNEPLVITGVLQQPDNYLEYTRTPVVGPIVRWRVRGEVLGANPSSCLIPRLVFWSSTDYFGEMAQQVNVSGSFQVDFWTSLPSQTTAVSPRITFHDNCFVEGTQIAIYAVSLAFEY